MSDKAEVLNKTNTSDTSTIGELGKRRVFTFNRPTSDEKSPSFVKGIKAEVAKILELPDGRKLKIFSNSSQCWYTGDINPVTGLKPKVTCLYLAR